MVVYIVGLIGCNGKVCLLFYWLLWVMYKLICLIGVIVWILIVNWMGVWWVMVLKGVLYVGKNELYVICICYFFFFNLVVCGVFVKYC